VTIIDKSLDRYVVTYNKRAVNRNKPIGTTKRFIFLFVVHRRQECPIPKYHRGEEKREKDREDRAPAAVRNNFMIEETSLGDDSV